LVSILIPAYNAAAWLPAAIESVRRQTWTRREVVVVDDGSTDETLRVARSFESASVRVLSQANRGAAGARNAALSLAQGDYIQWLDADDILHPDKITEQMKAADDGATSRTLMTCAWGRFFSSTEHARFSPNALWQTLAPAEWILSKFSHNAFMFPATWLVSRRLVDAAGPWDERLTLDDDGEYMCRLVAASDAVRFVPAARCYYRIGNASSLSWRKSDKALDSAHLSMKLCVARLLAMEDSDRARSACLRFIGDVQPLYYPERPDLVADSQALAQSLGCELPLPMERPHFRLFRQVFGFQAAKATRSRLARLRMQAARLAEGLQAVLPSMLQRH
jgi:glycosyltransferase involved in cell wall biosynthesis